MLRLPCGVVPEFGEPGRHVEPVMKRIGDGNGPRVRSLAPGPPVEPLVPIPLRLGPGVIEQRIGVVPLPDQEQGREPLLPVEEVAVALLGLGARRRLLP